ncbi:hypothetical protein SLS62_010070 [Diatrype stigma]|uniref:Uncharacterized protein n=1 Tax=Diatrype stigma TaxID=117547 RepID=A0AAN9YJ48_9PEZI
MVNAGYFLTVFAAAAAAMPAVTPNESFSALEARAGQVYTCRVGANNDGALLGEVSQDRAIGYLRAAGTKTGTASGYPKKFGNAGSVLKFASGCTSTNVWELPVLANNKPFDINKKINKGKALANDPGPMRVYYTDKLKFCGIGTKSNKDNSGNPHNCALRR